MMQTDPRLFQRPDARRTRVLLASGDPAAAAIASAALRADGHRVLTVGDPSELAVWLETVGQGLAESRARLCARGMHHGHLGPPPHVVILDAELGADAALALLERHQPTLRDVPVFLMLGDEPEEAHAALLAFPWVTVLRRPIDLDDLRTAVLNVDAWSRRRTATPPSRESRHRAQT